MNRLLQLLRIEEGLRLYVYDDANGELVVPGYTLKGHPTIGIGLALDTGGLTETEAWMLAGNRLRLARGWALMALPWFSRLDEVRQAVITLMIYQLGRRGFCGFKRMLEAMEEGDYERAAFEIKDSRLASQTPARAARLEEMMRSGKWPDVLSCAPVAEGPSEGP